jgi:NAD(P)-dependent dehydrogenase (short-subunit alcohol dehydrogenase family)
MREWAARQAHGLIPSTFVPPQAIPDGPRLAEVAAALPVATVQADMVDRWVIGRALAAVAPELLILNGGARSHMAPLPAQSWESFSRNWEVDVKAALLWIQAVLAGGMARCGRVLVSSNGAALNGSSLSGSYAGAKRMVWLLCEYANGAAAEQGLDPSFQPRAALADIGDTELGLAAAEAYVLRRGVTTATESREVCTVLSKVSCTASSPSAIEPVIRAQ